MKLLIIGVDGMSDRSYWDRDFPMNFLRDELIPKSLYGTSIATLQQNQKGRWDPHTGPNWSSIYTGVDSDIHGVDYGGWLFKHKSHGDLKVKSIWKIIREHFSLALMGMPVTYPVFDCDWMISGFPNSELTKKSVYPKNMFPGLSKAGFVTDYGDGKNPWRDKLYNSWTGKNGKSARNEKEKFFQIEFDKLSMTKRLYSANPVDVLAFGTTMIDKACHIFNMFSTPTMETYAKLDKLIARLVEHFDPENVIIASDHGFQPIKARHNEFGFYLWYSRDLKDLPAHKDIKITEVASIILESLGLLSELLGQLSTPEEYQQEDREGIVNRLKQLGYL